MTRMSNVKRQTSNIQYPIPNTQYPIFKLIIDSLLIIFAFTLAFGAVAWRLDRAPDVFTDEILYTRAGIRVAAEGALVWDSGEPLFVHPPFYFLAEGVYLWLTADPTSVVQAPGDIFAWVYHARHLNALLAGLTAAAFYLIGRRLRGLWLGLLLAALFVLDPFGVRINRRAMLETMAALLALAGIVVLLNGEKRLNPALAVVAGLLLGAGLLTKELTFTTPLAVLLFGLWELWRRRGAREQAAGSRRQAAGSRRQAAGSRRQAAGSPTQYSQPITPCSLLSAPCSLLSASCSLLPCSPVSLRAFLTVAVAGLTYGLFPLWSLTTGRWDRFAHVKWLSLNRLLGLTQLSGWNRSGVSLADFLVARLVDYGSSYLLLGLGGAAVLFLLLTRRHTSAGRLLTVWGLILYPFYTFTALVGVGNDQFFYFLLLPAMLLVSYAAAIFPEAIGSMLARRAATRRWLHTPTVGRGLRWGRTAAVILLLAAILPFNIVRWWITFGAGTDNAYYQLTTFAKESMPASQPLNASGDAIKFEYFFPDRPITDAATPEEAQAEGIHYFALAPKDVWARYGRTTPELAAWITAYGEPLFAAGGESYGEIYLYRVDYPDDAPGMSQDSTQTHHGASRPYARSFSLAQTGFVGSFLLALGLWGVWCSIMGGLATWIEWRWIARPLHLSPHEYYTNTSQALEART